MSPVLRPLSSTKKPCEEIINNTEPVVIKEEAPLTVTPTAVMESAPIVPPVESVITPSIEEDIKKEEKISAVLQELLDRKIDKTIESAEAILSTPPVDESSVQEVTTVSSVSIPENVTVTKIEEIVVNPIRKDVLPVLGQEIHVPSPVVESLPSTVITEEQVAVTSSSPLPAVESVNVIPINLIPQEIIPAPVIPQEAVVVATNIPTQAVVQAVTTPVAAVVAPKVHWFDKLFGSAPKTPPQQSV